MPLITRRWVPTDISAIQHIAWSTWLATYGSFIPEVDMRAFFDEYYTEGALSHFCIDEYARGFMAEYDGSPVGFAKTNLNRVENKFYLNSLYVLPEYQGKGIGSALLRVSENCGLSYKVDELWLGVMTQNVAALQWYKHIGFRFVREEPFTMGQTTVHHIIGYRAISQHTSET
jgi:diamine N-acetyltransferase